MSWQTWYDDLLPEDFCAQVEETETDDEVDLDVDDDYDYFEKWEASNVSYSLPLTT